MPGTRDSALQQLRPELLHVRAHIGLRVREAREKLRHDAAPRDGRYHFEALIELGVQLGRVLKQQPQ